MTVIEISALKKPIRATIDIPGSKSYTNRALVMAALTKGPVTLYNPLYSDDTEAMIACLRKLGLRVETFPERIVIHDDISIIQNKLYVLGVRDSGTTMRFLLALLCLTPGIKVIEGSARLNERPIRGLVDALRLLGAEIEYLEKEGEAPLKIHSSSLYFGCDIKVEASMSSQYISALLMIAPLLNGLKMHLCGELISRPYVDMTMQAMLEWGINILPMEDGGYDIPKGQSYNKSQYVIEGDFSSGGYFFAIAVLTRSTIVLKNLNPYSMQADRKFLDILGNMGNAIDLRDHEIAITGKQTIAQSLNMSDCPDQVQTMAVLAAFTRGITKISGVRSLRLKETERVKAIKNELAKMGIQTEDTHDTLTIYGGAPQAAVIDTYGDHRMAMAFAVAGTKLPGMKIRHPGVVNKTFPLFWDKLRSL